MGGAAFLKKYMPVIPTLMVMVSALTERGKRITIKALEAGAVDVVVKPKIGVVDELPLMMADLWERVKAAAAVDVSRYARPRSDAGPYGTRPQSRTRKPITPVEDSDALRETTDWVIAIGGLAHHLRRAAERPGRYVGQGGPIRRLGATGTGDADHCSHPINRSRRQDDSYEYTLLLAPVVCINAPPWTKSE